MAIEKADYGRLPDGAHIEEITLRGPDGMVMNVINYGAIISELHVPDRHGELADVVLGKDSLDGYLAGHPCFGTINGRVAGRITGGAFTLDGESFQLARNHGPNHLHGGLLGLDKRVWSAEALETAAAEPSLRLGYFSPDGEEGYPGNVRILVTYTLTAGNVLVIDYEATTDKPTPLNLTNHSYFNLAGHDSGRCDDQLVQIHADSFVPSDENLTLLGRVEPVDGMANDLRQPRRIGDVLPGLHLAHGDHYLLRDGGGGELVAAAELADPASSRVMRVATTEPCLQFYTAAMLEDGTSGKRGATYNRHQALCFECSSYPDGVNSPQIADIVLRPGQTYSQRSTYAFSTR